MKKPPFVSYLRVSTERQGKSGLGLEAQREAVGRHVAGAGGRLIREYVEVESGRKNDRPKLVEALAHAKATGATLVIAKLDRLSRNVAFIASLMESGVDFVAADMPMANRLTVHVLAAVAEHERHMISERTKRALEAKSERLRRGKELTRWGGRRLGNPNGSAALRGHGNAEAVTALKSKADEQAKRLKPIIEAIKGEGVTTLYGIAKELNAREIKTARGGRWYATSVKNVVERK